MIYVLSSLLAVLAPAEASVLSLRGEGAPVMVNLTELKAMPAVSAQWQQHDETHTVKGVPLMALAKRVGWVPGPAGKGVSPSEKHSGARAVIVVTASDGFQAVFSAAELTEGKTTAIVAWEIDGKPLAPDRGPLRLIVPTDSAITRSAYQVKSVDLIDMRKIVH